MSASSPPTTPSFARNVLITDSLKLLGSDRASPAWGPSRIAYVSRGVVWSVRGDGSDPRLIGSGSFPAWSGDGRLAFVVNESTVAVWSGSTAKKVHLPLTHIQSVAWSPDGQTLALTALDTAENADELYSVALATKHVARLTTGLATSAGPSWR